MNRFGVIDDFQTPSLSLDELLIANKTSTYFFRHQGESMSPFVEDGDLLLVDYSLPHFYQNDQEKLHLRLGLIENENQFQCRQLVFHQNKLAARTPQKLIHTLNMKNLCGVVTYIVRKA